jgi:hypothetical protein
VQHHSDYDNFHFAIHPDVSRTAVLLHMIADFILSRPTKYSHFILPLPYSMASK